jgi:hypothetical protein
MALEMECGGTRVIHAHPTLSEAMFDASNAVLRGG